jgi:hypothetical protein
LCYCNRVAQRWVMTCSFFYSAEAKFGEDQPI